MPSSYVVGHHFEQFIKQQIATGRYGTASEVIRDALRLLEDRQQLYELRVTEMHAAIEESRRDPRPPIPADEVWTGLEARYQAWPAVPSQ